MEAGSCTEVMNLYEWLPGYGESSIRIASSGKDLLVTVAYDSDNGELLEKTICFTSTCAFYASAFPGPHMLDISYSINDKDNLIAAGRLVEFPDSEAAVGWRRHFEGKRAVKHFMLVFLAENIRLEVFSERVQFASTGTA